MSGISPKLPLQHNNTDGHYGLNKTFKEATKQNLKNLILTQPGERVMDPFFGVGIRGFLFEMDGPSVRGSIVSRIQKQVEAYIPHIEIVDIHFFGSEFESDIADHVLAIRLKYKLLPINDSDILDITVE